MLHGVVLAVNDALGEADHVHQPADHGLRIAAAHCRIEARRFDVVLLGHSKLLADGYRTSMREARQCRLEDLLPERLIQRAHQTAVDQRKPPRPGRWCFAGKG